MTFVFAPIIPLLIFLIWGIFSLGSEKKVSNATVHKISKIFFIVYFCVLCFFDFPSVIQTKFLSYENLFYMKVYSGLLMFFYFFDSNEGIEMGRKDLVEFLQMYILASLIILLDSNFYLIVTAGFYYLRYISIEKIEEYHIGYYLFSFVLLCVSGLWLFGESISQALLPSVLLFYLLCVVLAIVSSKRNLLRSGRLSYNLKYMSSSIFICFFLLKKLNDNYLSELDNFPAFSILFLIFSIILMIYLFIKFLKEENIFSSLIYISTINIFFTAVLGLNWMGFGKTVDRLYFIQHFIGIALVGSVLCLYRNSTKLKVGEYAVSEESKDLIKSIGLILGLILISPFSNPDYFQYLTSGIFQNLSPQSLEGYKPELMLVFSLLFLSTTCFLVNVIFAKNILGKAKKEFKIMPKKWAKLDSMVLVFLLLLGFYSSNLYKYII